MSNPHDYSDYTDTANQIGSVMAGLGRLVAEAQKYEAEMGEYEEKAKAAKARMNAILEEALPAALRSAGVSEFKLSDGTAVQIKDVVQHSVSAANKAKAYDWLEKNGHEDIVKKTVSVALGVKEGDLAQKIVETITREFKRSAATDRKVEASTLKSVLTTLLEADTAFPKDLFGVREFQKADISTPKKKKKK